MDTRLRRATLFLTAALVLGGAIPVRADGFIAPFMGYNFGGDSGCPNLRGCEDKKLNVGVAFGKLGTVLGFEADLGYAKNFFGEAAGLDSSVLTLMSNILFAPKIGPVHPYVLAGVGLVKTDASLTPSSVLTSENNNIGWDVGGGVMAFFGEHVGVRGDIRHIHSFQDLKVLGFTLSSTKLDFGRASVGLVLKF